MAVLYIVCVADEGAAESHQASLVVGAAGAVRSDRGGAGQVRSQAAAQGTPRALRHLGADYLRARGLHARQGKRGEQDDGGPAAMQEEEDCMTGGSGEGEGGL